MILKRLNAVLDFVVTASAVVVGVLILMSVLMVTADVIGRYFFHTPLGWVLEVTEHFLVCIPFLAMAWLVRDDRHVRIDALVRALPARGQIALNIAVSLLGGLVCGVATYFAIETAFDHYMRGIVTYGIYPVPKFMLIAVVAFGLGLSTIEFARRFASLTWGGSIEPCVDPT